MAWLRMRPALALIITLLALAACDSASTTITSSTPTATTLPLPTATATLVPAPTPINVPSGWSVLAGQHFSLAYPADQKPYTKPDEDFSNAIDYFFLLPDGTGTPVRVFVYPQAQASLVDGYCQPASADIQQVTFASLPMTFTLTGEGSALRSWFFVNTQRTAFAIQAEDNGADAATEAADESILATFTPDDATPLGC